MVRPASDDANSVSHPADLYLFFTVFLFLLLTSFALFKSPGKTLPFLYRFGGENPVKADTNPPGYSGLTAVG